MKVISVLIVNFNSAKFTRECVKSLQDQTIFSSDRNKRLEIIVVDNASSKDDKDLLLYLKEKGIRLIFNEENKGYAGANNHAYSYAHGDYILILNPDTWLFPESLQSMIDFMEAHPEAGGVGPKIWWDKERSFLLPLSDPPGIGSYLWELSGDCLPLWGRFVSRQWLKASFSYWISTSPLKVKMLSGACILTRREVIEQVGLFDESYLLYFEDADWCLRALKKGYSLYYLPCSEVVHYYNQSAKLDSMEAFKKFNDAKNYYFQKHSRKPWGFIGKIFIKFLNNIARKRGFPRYQISDAGKSEQPFAFSCPGEKEEAYLGEFSPNLSFIPSTATFLEKPEFSIPLPIWKRLPTGRYFTRLTRLPSLEIVQIWSWEKGKI